MRKRSIAIFSILCIAATAAQGHGRHVSMFESADANGDGLVTRDEFMSARAERFAKLDRNGDGFIDRADAGEQAAERPRPAKRMRGMMARMDADGDGKVSQSEFVDAGAKMFDRADTDHSSSLDKTEIEAAKNKLRERRRQ